MINRIERQRRIEAMKHRTAQKQKKSDHPLEPGNRSATSQHVSKYKSIGIIHRIFRIVKHYRCECIALLWVLTILLFIAYAKNAGSPTLPADSQVAPTAGITATAEEPAEATATKRYTLTNDERVEIASVITAEAVGEPYAGKVAVAQCILQACEDDGIKPAEALTKYGYSSNRPEPCEESLKAVSAVFDCGQVATADPIKYFYAPALTESEWHEAQDYVMTINGHRFFAEKGE